MVKIVNSSNPGIRPGLRSPSANAASDSLQLGLSSRFLKDLGKHARNLREQGIRIAWYVEATSECNACES